MEIFHSSISFETNPSINNFQEKAKIKIVKKSSSAVQSPMLSMTLIIWNDFFLEINYKLIALSM